MNKTGRYRSLDLKSKTSGIKANSLFRIIAYLIDAILIRFAFEVIVSLLDIGGLISESLMENIGIYLGEGLAPFRGGGLMLEHFIFINSLEDVMIHLSYSALFMAYFIGLESKKLGGQTLGKKIFGIKVVNKSGSKASFKTSALRNSTKYLYRVPIVNFLLGVADFILLTLYSTRSGDLLADTEVINTSEKSILDWFSGSGKGKD